MKKALITCLFLLTGVFFHAQVEVYADCNYSGTQKTLSVKTYPTANQMGILDKSISSIKIMSGYKATVYTEPNMKGRKVVLTESVPCLPAVLDNSISSIVVEKDTSGSSTISNSGNISVYRGCNYRGSVHNFKPGTYTDLKTQLNGGTPESLQIPKGLVVEFYSLRNLKGKVLVRYTSNQDCLPASIIKGAKSMKVYAEEAPKVKPQPR